jgi:hypothetical protein
MEYLQNRRDFSYLLRIPEDETGTPAGMVEYDYWIMRVLYGLRQQDLPLFGIFNGQETNNGFRYRPPY